MKKLFMLLTILFTSVVILGACSGDDKTEDKTKDTGESDAGTLDSENKNVSDTNDDDANDLGIEEVDQLDLGIGDTGKIDSINGVFELTLDAAKVIKDELDGEESQLDDIILLDLTLKNTSDEILDVEDIMGNFEVTYTLDGTGTPDGAEYFDSVDKLTGELAPGEELKGQFVTYIYDKDEYYFRQRSGFSDSGKSNTVIFTFKADEAK